MHFLRVIPIFLLFLCHSGSSLDILGVFVYPSFQHWTVYNSLIAELSKRGHNLTVITNFPTTETSGTYREIHAKPFYNPELEVAERLQLKSISEVRKMDPRKIIETRQESGLSATRHFLASSTVKEFVGHVQDGKLTFDVMLVGDYYQEALLYLAELLNCPVVGLSPSGAEITSQFFLGLGALNIYRFHDLIERKVDVGYSQDTSIALHANKKFLENYLPQQEKLIKESFSLPEEAKVDFENLHKRVLCVLYNSHNFFTPPSPAVTGKEVLVGGFYIRPPKELPRDIKDFLHDANYGAIYVTLPSRVYGVSMDMQIVENLMKSFGGLRQKVLFEWDGEKVADRPKNVLVRKWIPISDILAHPYVQLMICSGDIWCIQNAIIRTVPLIGIPITKEQEILMKTVEISGIGRHLPLTEITAERVSNLTKEMYGNQMLIHQIHHSASFFRNRPLAAMEESAYWVEFAGKQKSDERIYTSPIFQGTATIPPYYTRLMTMFSALILLVVVILLVIASFVYKMYFKSPGGKRDKKAV